MAKKIEFNVFCSGVYRTHLIVDDDFCHGDLYSMSDNDFRKVFEYVQEHLNEAPIGEIEWINDIDVSVDDIKGVYPID